MLKGLYTSYTAMVNEQHRMDVLTNNLANVNTNGFKKEGATSQAFDDILALKIKDASESPNTAKRLGMMNLGVKVGEDYTDYSEGSFKETQNPTDFAIAGPGFFAIEHTNSEGKAETLYTRDGNFTMDEQGYLLTQEGDRVLRQGGGYIKCNPLYPIEVDTQGNIYQEINGARSVVAKIGITDFKDYNYLEHYGVNGYRAVEGAVTQTPERTRIEQGYLEGSNVKVVTEMVNMIAVQRAYDANQKVISTYDDTLEKAVNEIGRLT